MAMKLAARIFFLLLILLLSSPGRAGGDGLYGQLDRAFSLGLAAGGGLSAGSIGDAVSPVLGGQVDLFFLSTLGLKLSYGYNRKDLSPQLIMTHHSLTFSFEFRFLFPLIFFNNLFSGSQTFDLIIYSLGFEIGGSLERSNFAFLGERFGDSNFGFHLGFGFEIPLVRRSGRGWFLRIQFLANFLPPLAVKNHGIPDLDNYQLMVYFKYRFQFLKDI